MRRWTFPTLVITLFCSAGLFLTARNGARAPQAPFLAIVGATIVDGTGGEPFVGSVLVRGDRIEAVGEQLALPDNGTVIEARGLTLMPGLFDLHTHASSSTTFLTGDWRKHLMAYLYSGVTTIVDFGAFPETFEDRRRLIRDGLVEGPSVLLAARFTTPLGHGATLGQDHYSAEVLTPRHARTAFERVLPYGPDLVKVFTDGWRYGTAPEMTSMTEETLSALAQEARSRGIRVLSHTVTLERAKIASRAGVNCLAHAVCDRPADAELIQLLEVNGTFYAPTMAVYEVREPPLESSFLRAVLEPAVREVVSRSREQAGIATDPQVRQLRERRWRNVVRNTRALHQAGIPITLATDAGVTGTFHGWASLRELELLVSAGLSPLEAIRAGTETAARALGLQDTQGTIAPGKRADLLLVAGAPHQEISDIWKVQRVFHKGREVNRERLRREIQRPEPLPPELVPARQWVDDFESPDGRSRAGSLWYAGYETGHDRTQVRYFRQRRAPDNHVLFVLVELADRPDPFGRLTVPLSRGGMKIVDLSHFEGIRFKARGDGPYRLIVQTLAVRDGEHFYADLSAGPFPTDFALPFSSLRQPDSSGAGEWTGRDVLAISFELAGSPRQNRWLELDDIRFY